MPASEVSAMNKGLGIAALALSAVALVVSLTRDGGAAPEPAPAEPATDRPDRAEVAAQDDGRLSSLEMELSRLMKRVDTLERAGLPRPGEPAQAMTTEQQASSSRRCARTWTRCSRGAAGDRGGPQAAQGGAPLGAGRDVRRPGPAEGAQQAQGRADRVRRFVEEARLSATQAQDLTRLLDDEAEKRRSLWDARRGANAAGGQPGGVSPGQQMRDQMRALRAATDASAKSILGADQYTQYEAMRSEERGGGRGGGGFGGGGGNRRGPRGGCRPERPGAGSQGDRDSGVVRAAPSPVRACSAADALGTGARAQNLGGLVLGRLG
jgi:hypothetical protein